MTAAHDLDRIPLARPALGDAEVVAAERALRSGRLVLGPENERFEAALAARTGRRYAVAVSSGTAALELALWVLRIGPGDEVLVPAFGFPAAANAVRARGATAIPIDVDERTWNLDLERLGDAIGPRARAIVSIDQFGLVAEAYPLERMAAGAGLALIDDAACSLGGTDTRGTPGGGYGLIATLSFHPRKVVTTGEGGALLTDDDRLADELRRLRNHGQVAPGAFSRVGTNARLGEVAAAIGRAQLERLDTMLSERRLLAEGYRRRLAPLVERGRISVQDGPPKAMHAYQTFAVRLAEGLDRAAVQGALAAAGIESGPATYAFHRVGSFASAGRLPPLERADALHDRALALPLYIGMRSGELDRVAEALARAVDP